MENIPKEILITPEDEKQFQEKVEYIDKEFPQKLKKAEKRISFIEDVIALYNYLKDNSVKWYRKLIVVSALLYFITPIDTIPDLAPLVGYLDDLGVIAAAIKYIGSEIKPYYRYQPTQKKEEEEEELLF
ncbi:MAG: YkvA family protein [Ignavibacteria bacterium]|nr:YkvA family protein [Ignavibacteria bacterium]